MTGLIQMDEYLKVVRERDRLAEELDAANRDLAQRRAASTALEAQFRVGVSATQARIVLCLVQAYPDAARMTELRSQVGHFDDEDWLSDSNLKVQISKLRRRLAEVGAPGSIHNLMRGGYRIDAPMHDWIQEKLAGPARKQGRA